MEKQTYNAKEALDSDAVAQLVQAANQFDSVVLLNKGDKTANAKSIMGMMSLNVKAGESVTVSADGTDANKVLPALEDFFK